MTCCGVVFVAAYAFDVYGLAVDKELAIFDFDFAEADVVAEGLDRLAVGVGEGEYKPVEIGSLGGPFGGISEFDGGSDVGIAVCGQVERVDLD